MASGSASVICFSAKRTPGYAGESKKDYILKNLQVE